MRIYKDISDVEIEIDIGDVEDILDQLSDKETDRIIDYLEANEIKRIDKYAYNLEDDEKINFLISNLDKINLKQLQSLINE